MTQKAYGIQMQKSWLSRTSDKAYRILGDLKGMSQIAAVCSKVAEIRPAAECPLNPTGRSTDRNTDPVILAYE
jgi:hypothetical protein